MNEITIPLKITYDPKREKNSIHLKFDDMCVNITDDKGNIVGSIDVCIGGGIEFKIEENKKIYFASTKDLWNAFVKMMGYEKYIIE